MPLAATACRADSRFQCRDRHAKSFIIHFAQLAGPETVRSIVMNEFTRNGIALAASMLTSATFGGEFNARGNEPSWSIRKSDTGITFSTPDGRAVTIAPLPPVQSIDGGERYRSVSGGKTFTMLIANKVCTDTMSGMPFPKSVTVEIGEEKLFGCGGDPADLLRSDWTIENIGGKPTMTEHKATLSFGTDAQLSGNGSCNRYFGSYTLSGEGLTISGLGSSMMMCEQPVMDQESLFLDTLRNTQRFEIAPDNRLSLYTKDGRSIVARRDR
jgi:heat shock protein HslJ